MHGMAAYQTLSMIEKVPQRDELRLEGGDELRKRLLTFLDCNEIYQESEIRFIPTIDEKKTSSCMI